MKKLQNNCRVGKMSVQPKNWKQTGADISMPWTITYYFYDDNRKEKKQVRMNGMNDKLILKERQQATAFILEEENRILEAGYNPITGIVEKDKEVTVNTLFIPALQFALDKIKCSKKHKATLNCNLNSVIKAIKSLSFDRIFISEISRRHIKLIMDWIDTNHKGLTDNLYNTILTHFGRFFEELSDYEVVKENYPSKIDRRDVLRKKRQILSDAEAIVIDKYLKKRDYNFWRFVQIFFQSGRRIAEFMRIQARDVDISNRQYVICSLKGSKKRYKLCAITNEALPLWIEILTQAKNEDDYVFSEKLKPGEKNVESDFVTKNWKKYVKKELNINCDLYSLKHLFLDKISGKNGIGVSMSAAGHSDIKTTRIYTVEEDLRDLKKTKEINISFTNKNKKEDFCSLFPICLN